MEDGEEIVCNLLQIFFLCDSWKGDRLGKPVEGEDVFSRLCGGDRNLVASAVFRRWADVVPFCAVGSKGRTLSRGIMDEDFGAWYCQGGAVKVEITKKTDMGRKFRLTSGRT